MRLNEKHSTTATIGEDGVGFGTIDATGFSGSIANFSTRPNVKGGASVTTPYIVFSMGELAKRN